MNQPAKSVKDRLAFPAVPDMLGSGPSLDEIRDEIVRTEEQTQDPEVAALEDKRLQRDWTFQFKFTDGSGKVFEGSFTNRVPDIATKLRIHQASVKLSGGAAWEALPPRFQSLCSSLAYMTFSLIEKPKWANDLRAVLDEDLVFALFEEVFSHERTFLGRKDPEGAGEAAAE
jgi:hypothetical protein